MRIWINAFIPHTVPGYTVTIAQGANVNMTAVPLPLIARLNPLNTFKPLSAGYLTDQRSFDSNPAASVRMQCLATLSLGPAGWNLDHQGEHRTSGTTEVDILTGETLGHGLAPMDRCSFAGAEGVAVVPGLPFTQFVHLKASAADPLVSAAADIDFVGAFQITTWMNPVANVIHVNWALQLDAFPAFEGYVEHNGVVKTVLAVLPDPGMTVQNLPGTASRPFQGMVMFP
ncbi:hypothetical protein SRABI26_03706 [Arthrobacter sp. Bi26]|uniref:hypothetical protein n=1 Tax=Arthrobacter sp. Bi26 TaxID=2822350 RepID=UPI001DE32EB8|nr:hypothetical protein [Arthrobacter sp. Bi26]CAH0272556.1 hypothetical protein SRABI26_03706 [Arthrobacter sp. Bi26]